MGRVSLIRALHDRYVDAWAEHNRIDDARPALAEDHKMHSRLNAAMDANSRESGAIRDAILHQVPIDMRELTILAYHAWDYFDPHCELPDSDKLALETALLSIFDYLMGEGHLEMDSSETLRSATMLAYNRRRDRTGVLPVELGGEG